MPDLFTEQQKYREDVRINNIIIRDYIREIDRTYIGKKILIKLNGIYLLTMRLYILDKTTPCMLLRRYLFNALTNILNCLYELIFVFLGVF
jgi:hypothetical protein